MLKKLTVLMILVLGSACDRDDNMNSTSDENTAVNAEVSLLIHNATIYTMDPQNPRASAMLVSHDGEILQLGEGQSLLMAHPDARHLDLAGNTVLPGLIDAHGHLYGLAISLSQAPLQGTTSKEGVIRILREHEAKLADGDWLLGRGWDQNDWPVTAFPTRGDLDSVFPDRPVWLRRIDGHAGWANSAALAMADRELSGSWQPQGGLIHRNAAGDATGIMVDGAMALVQRSVPAISPELLQASLDLALRQLVSNGLTGVHDPGIDRSVLELYRRRIESDQFPTRVYAMTDGAGDTLAWLCENGVVNDASGRLYMRSTKLYIDGALGSRGAALLADYSDDPGNTGLLFMPQDELEADIDRVLACGYQVAVHAIGDRGNRTVLDALEHVTSRHPGNPGRHRIEHVQTLTAMDLPRFAGLGIIAAMQPTHATSDMYWAGERLGPERARYAYSWRSLNDSGAKLALGSDFPVEEVNPMLGIYAAVSRQDLQGWPEGGWYASETLSREAAVRGFTLDAAYAGFMEDSVGSLEPGKRADFIVLDRDIMQVEASQIPATKVLQTWLDGERVWQHQVQ